MTVTLNLSPETEQALREKAARYGLALETYLEQVVERDTQAANAGPGPGSGDQVSPAEFDRRLDELSEGLPPHSTLPTDWTRADLYTDRDRCSP